ASYASLSGTESTARFISLKIFQLSRVLPRMAYISSTQFETRPSRSSLRRSVGFNNRSAIYHRTTSGIFRSYLTRLSVAQTFSLRNFSGILQEFEAPTCFNTPSSDERRV